MYRGDGCGLVVLMLTSRWKDAVVLQLPAGREASQCAGAAISDRCVMMYLSLSLVYLAIKPINRHGLHS